MTEPIRAIFEQYYYLFATLLVQVAAMAMTASLLLRFPRFTRLVLADPAGRKERVEFGIVLGVVVAIGSWTRLYLGYAGTDLTVVGPLASGLFMGLDAGPWTGFIGGLIPLRNGEWLTCLVGVVIGIGAGLARRLYRNPASLRYFSPVPFGNLGHIWRRWKTGRAFDSRLIVIGVGTAAEVMRTELARFAGERWLFSYHPDEPIAYFAVIMACLTSVGVAIKIWSTPRIEALLRKHEALLAEARLDALRGQINPHFLFNTLNTIGILIRKDPEQARVVIVRLSSLLRRMLYSQERTSSLGKELDFVEDYLGIELIRFGSERLRVERKVAQEALVAEVPSMLLQPLVENAIKHGISPKETGGVITVGASVEDGWLRLSIKDNGIGMSQEALRQSLRRGIGLTNVRERLRSIHGDSYRLEVESTAGEGTLVRISFPYRIAGGSHRGDDGTYIQRRIRSAGPPRRNPAP